MNIPEIIAKHPVGPHRRLYLLLKLKLERLRLDAHYAAMRARVCECGARVTNQNPKATKCNHCYALEREAANDLQERLAERAQFHSQAFEGFQRRRFTLDDYER